ncbi:MAG: hypothetical protein CMB80_10775 [Flammeovirgaceae bacterium]|nr:hypothetical protein [Flammeovirgaceae bacterium]
MVKNLTYDRLRRIVLEEKKKIKKSKIKSVEDVETEEGVWSGGDNLVNHINFVKQLGITETKLREKADKLSKARNLLKKRLMRNL